MITHIQEIEAIEGAVKSADSEIERVESQLANMRAKQFARLQELGFQKARHHYQAKVAPKYSVEPIPGGRAIAVQTQSGIETRWVAAEEGGQA